MIKISDVYVYVQNRKTRKNKLPGKSKQQFS